MMRNARRMCVRPRSHKNRQRHCNKVVVIVMLAVLAISSPAANGVPLPQPGKFEQRRRTRILWPAEPQNVVETKPSPSKHNAHLLAQMAGGRHSAFSRYIQLFHSRRTRDKADTRKMSEAERISLPAPVIVMAMVAVPPRDRIPGSTKGMPYKVRIVHAQRKRRGWRREIKSHGLIETLNRQLFWGSRNTSGDLDEEAEDEEVDKNGTVTMDLHGGIVGVGEYFSVIEIGGKKMRVQVDTGSSTLAVPMEGCVSCLRKSNLYNPARSPTGHVISCDSDMCAAGRCSSSCAVCSSRGACCSTEKPGHCGFSLRYADGSALSGSLVHDEMIWGSLRSNVTFGGILHNSANFERPEVDGILGMAYKSLACNPSCFEPPFDSLVNSGKVQDVFSICMTGKGGKLMLGGIDKTVAKTEIQYVHMSHAGPERYYRVSLGGSIWIGSEKVNLPNFRTAIVDTGTTLIVMSTKSFSALRKEFQRRFCDVPELCETDSWFQSGMCVSLSDTDMKRLPTLTMELGGSVRVALRAEDYMLSYKRGKKMYRCVGIMGMDGLGGMVVLGNTLMQRYVTVYDRSRGMLGFAEAADRCGDL